MAKFLNILRPEQFQLIHHSFLHYFITLFIQKSLNFKCQDGKPQKGPSGGTSCCGYMLLTCRGWKEKPFSMTSNRKARQILICSSDTFPIVSVFLTPSVGLLCWCCHLHKPTFSCLVILCFQHVEWFCTSANTLKSFWIKKKSMRQWCISESFVITIEPLQWEMVTKEWKGAWYQLIHVYSSGFVLTTALNYWPWMSKMKE